MRSWLSVINSLINPINNDIFYGFSLGFGKKEYISALNEISLIEKPFSSLTDYGGFQIFGDLGR